MSAPAAVSSIVAATLFVGASPALAEGAGDERPPVELTVDPCIDASPEAMRRASAIELGTLLTAGAAADSSSAKTRVNVTCEGGLAKLHVDDPITGKSIDRLLDLSASSKEARPRLLAIAIAELVSASWTELETNPEPSVPPAGPRASDNVRRAALSIVQKRAERRLPRRPYIFQSDVGIMSFVKEPEVAFFIYLGLRLHGPILRSFGWMVDAHLDASRERTSLGHVDETGVSFGAALTYQHTFGKGLYPTELRIGPGIRGGPMFLKGLPADAGAVRGEGHFVGWGGPMLNMGMSIGDRSGFRIHFGAELGYVLFPAGGLIAGRREITIEGIWGSIGTGVGTAF